MTDTKTDGPSLAAIYVALSTELAETAIREEFLEHWLPVDRSAIDRCEAIKDEAEVFVDHMVEATRQELRAHLLSQDASLDPDATPEQLRKSTKPFFYLPDVGLENLPPLSPPPTEDEIRGEMASTAEFNAALAEHAKKYGVAEELRSIMHAYERIIGGKRASVESHADQMGGAFAAAYAPDGDSSPEPTLANEEDSPEEQLQAALEGVYIDRMLADVTERFLPEILAPIVAAQAAAKQGAGPERTAPAGEWAGRVEGTLTGRVIE